MASAGRSKPTGAKIPIHRRPLPPLHSTPNRFHTKSQSHDQSRSVFSSNFQPRRPSAPSLIGGTNLKQRVRPQSARRSSAKCARVPPSRSLPSLSAKRSLPSTPEKRTINAANNQSSKPIAKPQKPETVRRASFNTASLIKPSRALKTRKRKPKLSLQTPLTSWKPPTDDEDEKSQMSQKTRKKKKKRKGWIRGEMIGAGAFGKVYKMRRAYSGELCAMKEITISRNIESSVIDREVQIMRRLTHKHIVRFLDFRRGTHSVRIYMEFIHGETLCELYQRKGRLKESVIAKYTAQLLQALVCAHSRKVIHRDIKGANIMISEADEVKLVDLGAAKLWEKGNSKMAPSVNFQHSPLWTAPEIVSPPWHYDSKADVWSLGCVMIEMATAALPWAEENFKMPQEAMFKIGKGGTPRIPMWLSEECRDFMQLCLRRDPDKRCSASELIGHTFVKGYL